jgi:hypothetical protein
VAGEAERDDGVDIAAVGNSCSGWDNKRGDIDASMCPTPSLLLSG